MKRKVSKIGQSTLMVSLPHQWVKEQGIEKGDEVEIEAKGSIVEISTDKKKKKEKKEYKFCMHTENEKVIRIYLNTLYRVGYDRIVIEYKSEKTLNIIRYLVTNYLLGFEIVHEEENKCILESLTEPTEEKADVLLRKVFFIMYEVLAIITEDIKKGSFERLSTVQELMMRFDRFCNFFSRTLFKEKQLDPFRWQMVQKLLMAQHTIYYCYKAIVKSKHRRFSSGIIAYLEDTKRLVQGLETFYYKKDFTDIEKIVRLKEDLLYHRISEVQKTKEGIFISPYLFGIVKTIPTLGGSIQEFLK
ncbi:phosphate uptake regulator PhoU [Candidatus Woesearchaeota archaeon]|nr:phosphate uptake regulator PhoU [Candidatus Woesearchaeota archaeon]